MAEVHPPKIETFDVAARTNTDPKGIVRKVDEYREHPHGLYMARATPGRRQFHYIESWLLPGLSLRATDFRFNPGYERDQDFYLDVVTVDRRETTWRTTDLYLDIAVRRGRGLDVIDTGELLDAVGAGHLSATQAAAALRTTYTAVDGLARHDYDLNAWLATQEVHLTWQRHPT